MILYRLSRLPIILLFIDLAKYQWFRKKVGGTWYYGGILVDLGRHKHFWWTKAELNWHVREIEVYD